MDKALIESCKKLHFGSGLAAKAKKIKADTPLEFLLQLFNSEIEERERKRRNSYMKAAKFDIIKTFENYTFEDIKFPVSLTADDTLLIVALFPKGKISYFTTTLAQAKPTLPLLPV